MTVTIGHGKNKRQTEIATGQVAGYQKRRENASALRKLLGMPELS